MKIPSEIVAVAEHLGDLRQDVVFVGGMVRSLLVTDPVVPGYRPTKDVDVIVDVSTYAQHATWLEKFRARGFREDTSDDAPICRYVLKGAGIGQGGIPVDVMPLEPQVLGFANRWYPQAFESATSVEVPSGAIRVINAAHFVATKLSSFEHRGNGDFYHHDVEDVIVLVDGRPSLLEEVEHASSALRTFVADAIAQLLSQTAFRDTLPGHLPPDAASQARAKLVLARLTALAVLR